LNVSTQGQEKGRSPKERRRILKVKRNKADERETETTYQQNSAVSP